MTLHGRILTAKDQRRVWCCAICDWEGPYSQLKEVDDDGDGWLTKVCPKCQSTHILKKRFL